MVKSIYQAGVSGTWRNTNSQGYTSVAERGFPYSGIKSLVISTSGNPGGNNAFQMDSGEITGGVVSGQYGYNEIDKDDFSSYPLTIHSYGGVAGATFGDGYIDPNDIFGATNPFRPQLLLPAFIAELRELPKMIRDLGRLKLGKKPIYRNTKDIAREWVGLNFGWKPLIGDLMSIVDIGLGIAERQKEVDRLYSKSGLKRRLGLGKVSAAPWLWIEYPPGRAPWTPIVLSCKYECERWAVVKYKPAADTQTGKLVPPPDTNQMRRIMAGLTSEAAIASAWELLPWSWLIDYSVNIGGFLNSKQQGWRFEIERACLMKHYTCIGTSEGQSHTDALNRTVSVSSCTARWESKTRQPILPPTQPNVRMPVLSGTQLSILGSLATMRSRGLRIT